MVETSHLRPRAVLYLRQSTHREESISLELQEFDGRAHAERHGYDVVAVESDPGISGRTWKRPAVERVMRMIDQREADVIVLWKWSRLSRSRLDWAVAADKVETAGGRIESATEPLDTTTSTGRLARGMMTEFAAFESERIGDVWKESHARRVRAGLPLNGKPRFGYVYERADGFSADPVTGPVLADAYRRYIAGESMYSLVSWLNDGATRPVGGYGVKSDGLWSDRTLRRVMDSGFAAGLINYRGESLPGAHQPLISADEWEAYQEARQRRRVYRRTERSDYLLSGLVWCACGSKMHAGQFGTARVAKFRCKDAHAKRTHAGGYVSEHLLIEAVTEWLGRYEDELNELSKAAARTLPAAVPSSVTDQAKIQRRIDLIDSKLEALAERLIDPGIPFAIYTKMRDKLLAEQSSLQASILTIAVSARTVPVSLVHDLRSSWDDFTLAERRETLRHLIAQVKVTPGRPRASIQILPR